MTALLTPVQTAACLPWRQLVDDITHLLTDDSALVPARLVQSLHGGGSLFVMPASDRQLAIVKLITFTPANAGKGRPAIQGDVVVFDVITGERMLILDGPTVTARRTAAVSALAAQRLAPHPQGPLLVVGAGVQGRAHVEAFAALLGVSEVFISSRSLTSADALATHARALGLKVRTVQDADAAMADCTLVVTCTPAHQVVLSARPRPHTFIAAVGAFTPRMLELEAGLCRYLAAEGSVFVDTVDACHEAGDLMQAGLDLSHLQTLADVVRQGIEKPAGPVLFKSCGWAGWDLAAARTATKAEAFEALSAP